MRSALLLPDSEAREGEALAPRSGEANQPGPRLQPSPPLFLGSPSTFSGWPQQPRTGPPALLGRRAVLILAHADRTIRPEGAREAESPDGGRPKRMRSPQEGIRDRQPAALKQAWAELDVSLRLPGRSAGEQKSGFVEVHGARPARRSSARERRLQAPPGRPSAQGPATVADEGSLMP